MQLHILDIKQIMGKTYLKRQNKATANISFAKVHLKKYIYYQLIFIDYQYIYIIFASQF